MTDDELRARVAERVMGWLWEPNFEIWEDERGDLMWPAEKWDPLTRWDHAGLVVERMNQLGWLCTTLSNQGHNRAAFERALTDSVPPYTPIPIQRFDAEADTLPRAIALASLAAVEQDGQGSFVDRYQEDLDREDRERAKWSLGDYDNGETGCPRCGRNRLCLCPNGKHRCEKCNWSPELGDYVLLS